MTLKQPITRAAVIQLSRIITSFKLQAAFFGNTDDHIAHLHLLFI